MGECTVIVPCACVCTKCRGIRPFVKEGIFVYGHDNVAVVLISYEKISL